MKVFVSTHPFATVSREPLDLLEQEGIQAELNPYGRKIKPDELRRHLRDADALVAGTEKLDRETLQGAPRLKVIARVGIGIDGIDFDVLQEREIRLTYTPEAVSQAVAELTVGNMINLARFIPQIHLGMKSGQWTRPIGFEICGKTIGIIGFGRVGRLVAKMLQGFSCRILANDIAPDEEVGSRYGVRFCTKEEIYANADILTLHVPRTPLTTNLVDEGILEQMKPTACLINTSRGGIVNETDLYNALANRRIAGAALDVYEIEPYIGGRLCELENVLLTCHSGSCSAEARRLMELGAAAEVVRFHRGEAPLFPVPEEIIRQERAVAVTPINAEWHEVFNSVEARAEERYKLYRRRWGQYPTHSIVGEHPLNIDIELVCNPVRPDSRQLELSLAAPSEGTEFMGMSLFEEVMHELRSIREPTAVKLGFRGDPLYHPEIGRAMAACKAAGSIETIVTTTHEALTEERTGAIVESQLDVLNLFVKAPAGPDSDRETNEAVIGAIQRLKQLRLANHRATPKLRVMTEMDPQEEGRMRAFVDFWRHWADVVAVFEALVPAVNTPQDTPAVRWTCSRLWQRLVIAHDGSLLCCNYDVHEQGKVGAFPQTSIGAVWRGAAMASLREFHRAQGSRLPEPCHSCPFRATEIRKLKF